VGRSYPIQEGLKKQDPGELSAEPKNIFKNNYPHPV
jgi:hypothetical protein